MQKNRPLHRTLSLTFNLLMIFATISIAHSGDFRSMDGTGNNISNPLWGSAGIQLRRTMPADYTDGISQPAGQTTGAERKSPREISNIMAAQEESILNSLGASDFLWQWGQFLDHDIDLTTEIEESWSIPVPKGDAYFDPSATGGQTIVFNRSVYDDSTGTSNPRQQINTITSFIDASNVYGSDEDRATALRKMDGSGKLKSLMRGRFLPFNREGLPNAGGDDNRRLFLAGDIRANEQIALTAMHTLFMREHNRLCDEMAGSGLDGEEIYQRARKIVGAQMQVITYKEFLPLLLGPTAIPPYGGYNDQIDPTISNEFSGAAYRFGHSMLSPGLLLVDKRYYRWNRELMKKAFINPRLQRYGITSIPLNEAFFNPFLIFRAGGIDSIIRGLAMQQAQEVDNKTVDAVRNFLFGDPGEGGFDLASANIQRGRDHGIVDYNSVRLEYGLAPLSEFTDIPADKDVQDALSEAYDNVNTIDLWVGGLAENHVPGAFVGETVHAILVDQFLRLRDGDRFWYENDPFFTGDQLTEIENTTLADVIRRNTKIGDELPDDVFRVQN